MDKDRSAQLYRSIKQTGKVKVASNPASVYVLDSSVDQLTQFKRGKFGKKHVISRPRSALAASLKQGTYEALHSTTNTSTNTSTNHDQSAKFLPFVKEGWNEQMSKQVLQQWLGSYKHEEESFNSSIVWFETVLEQLSQATWKLQQPNTLSTTVSAFLLLKLGSIQAGQWWPVMKKLFNSVFSAIFDSWSDVEEFFLASETPDSLLNMEEDLFEDKTCYFEVQRLVREKMGKEHANELAKMTEKMNELTGTLERTQAAVKAWRDFSLRRCFYGWRGGTSRKRGATGTITRIHVRHTNQSNSWRLKHALTQWKVFVGAAQIKKRQTQLEVTTTRTKKKEVSLNLQISDLRTQHIQQNRDNESFVAITEMEHKKHVQSISNVAEELETECQELRDINTTLLDEVRKWKNESLRWYTLTMEIYNNVKGESELVHPNQFLLAGQLDVDDDEEPLDPAELLTFKHGVDEILMRWVNAYIKQAEPVYGIRPQCIENFNTDIKDCTTYLYLLHELFPGQCGLEGLAKSNDNQRAMMMLQNLEKIGIPRLIEESDIVNGKAIKNVAFVAFLFSHYSIMNWIGNGRGRTALLQPYDEITTWNDDDTDKDTDNGSVTRIAMNQPHSHSTILPTDRFSKTDIQLDPLFVDTRTRIPHVTVRSERRNQDRQNLTSELNDNPYPEDAWNQLQIRDAFLTHVNVYRAWAYLGYHCSSGSSSRLLRLRYIEKVDQALDVRRQTAVDDYSAINMAPFADYVKDLDEKAIDTEIGRVKAIIVQYFDDIKQIFQYYSSLDAGFTMSQNGYWSFCKDCRIARLFKKNTLEQAYIKACAHTLAQDKRITFTGAKTKTMKGGSTDDTLHPAKWIDCLIRLAYKKYTKSSTFVGQTNKNKDKDDDGILPDAVHNNLYITHSISEALKLLLTEYVIPHSSMSSIDDFRVSVRQPGVQKQLKKHEKMLQKTFKYYASGAGNNYKVIDYHNFLKMSNECKLLDSNFLSNDIISVFIMVQDHAASAAATDAALELNYDEWMDAIVCIAIFKYPAPYIPLANRLEKFLTKNLFPSANKYMTKGN